MGLESLFSEFEAHRLTKELSNIDTEQRDGIAWKVFYVVAPDGPCYWFGGQRAGKGSAVVAVGHDDRAVAT